MWYSHEDFYLCLLGSLVQFSIMSEMVSLTSMHSSWRKPFTKFWSNLYLRMGILYIAWILEGKKEPITIPLRW